MSEAFPTQTVQSPIDFSVMMDFPVDSPPQPPMQTYMPVASPANTTLNMLTPGSLLEPFRARAKELEVAASGIKITSDEDQTKATK